MEAELRGTVGDVPGFILWLAAAIGQCCTECFKGCVCGCVDWARDDIKPFFKNCGLRVVRCVGFVGDHLGVYKPQDNAWPMFGAGATLAAAEVGAAASLKDEDNLVYPMLAAACFALCSVLLSVRLSLAVPSNQDWLKDLSGFAVLFLILSLVSTIVTFFIWKPWALHFLIVIVPVVGGLCLYSPGD